MIISRKQKVCALCKYWNGSIGSETIKVQPGANTFMINNKEQHECFKINIGICKSAIQTCQYFKQRYED